MQTKVQEEHKYEREFVIASILFLAVCSTVAVLAPWISKRYGIGIDGPTIASYIAFAFSTAVGFAGAWVVIKIANVALIFQETTNRLQEFANNQQELSNTLQDPDYEAAHAAALELEALRSYLAQALAIYRLHRRSPEIIYGKNSPLKPMLLSIRDLVLGPNWQGVISGFCMQDSERLRDAFDAATAILISSTHEVVHSNADDTDLERQKRLFVVAFRQAEKLCEYISIAVEKAKASEDFAKEMRGEGACGPIERYDERYGRYKYLVRRLVKGGTLKVGQDDFEGMIRKHFEEQVFELGASKRVPFSLTHSNEQYPEIREMLERRLLSEGESEKRNEIVIAYETPATAIVYHYVTDLAVINPAIK